MPTFECAAGWNSRGFFDDTKYNNHESNLDENEMKTLAGQAIAIPGFKDIPAPAVAGSDPFYTLSQALQADNGTIEIVKGVHQRGDDGGDIEVHFTLRIGGTTRQYHIFVGEGSTRTQRVVNNQKTGYYDRLIFKYKCTGASYVADKIIHNFPPAFVKTGVRKRGGSFSVGNTNPQLTGAEMFRTTPIPTGVPLAQRTSRFL